MAYNRGGELA